MSVKMDDKDLKKFERDLKNMRFKAIPFATKETLNNMAFDGMFEMRRQISRKMIERNTWTKRSIGVNKAQTLTLKRQSSEFGSTQEYMVLQEEGGIEKGRGGSALSIPTSYAAGQEGVAPRTKLPRKPNKMRNIRLTKSKTRGKSRKQRNFLKVREAREKNLKFIFMDLGRRKGVFRLTGPKKNTKIKMVADVSRKIIRIRPKPTMKPAAKFAENRSDDHYKKALLKQLTRHGLYRG